MFDIDNVAVIRNGIDFDRFTNPKKSRQEIREELSIPEDAYVIGQVSRFAYQKNPEFTINIFNEIQKRKDNVYLILVGRVKTKMKLIYQN